METETQAEGCSGSMLAAGCAVDEGQLSARLLHASPPSCRPQFGCHAPFHDHASDFWAYPVRTSCLTLILARLTSCPTLIPITGFGEGERANYKSILIQNLLLGAKTLAAIAEENPELLTDKKLAKVRHSRNFSSFTLTSPT